MLTSQAAVSLVTFEMMVKCTEYVKPRLTEAAPQVVLTTSILSNQNAGSLFLTPLTRK